MVLSPITSLGKRQARYDFDVRIRLSLSESAFKRPAPRKIPADHQRSSLGYLKVSKPEFDQSCTYFRERRRIAVGKSAEPPVHVSL
jgi:hypothetical protein